MRYKDPVWLKKMYWKNEMTTHRMAVVASCSRWTIEHYMEEFGIPRRTMPERQRLAWKNDNKRRLEQSGRSKIQMTQLWQDPIFRANFLTKVSGPNHHAWSGRNGPLVYPDSWTLKDQARIRDRDNHVCILCGALEVVSYAHDTHHIDYDVENNDPFNIVTLCRSCHMKTNYNHSYWQEKLTLLVQHGIERIPLI